MLEHMVERQQQWQQLAVANISTASCVMSCVRALTRSLHTFVALNTTRSLTALACHCLLSQSVNEIHASQLMRRVCLFEMRTMHVVSLSLIAPCGPGHPSFPLVHLLPHLLLFLLFPFVYWLYLFSSFVHHFLFYQNSPTPFPDQRS